MKNLIICFALFLNLSAFAQSKITYLYDKDLLNADVETLLAANLKAYNLEYSSQIDLNRKCDFLFGAIRLRDNQIYLEIKDCYEFSRGSVLVGKLNQKDNAQAYAGALSFLTNDILQNPEKYKSSVAKTDTVIKENEHASRYFFAPSAYNLKKGELYGATNYFLAYDFQYGITDNFSLGMGSTIAAIPFYITPKLSFKVGEKSRVSVGDMLVLGTWGTQFTMNLAYGVYTYGSSNSNVSLGLAYLTASGADIDSKLSQPVINLSAMARLSEYMFIVSENYFTPGSSQRTESEYLGYDPVTFKSNYKYYNYERNSNIAMGALGFRFISKKRDVQSIQFGLAYFINSYTDKYENNVKTAHVVETTHYNQFFIPTLSFFYKFGRKV
jgi:hypothetical protein